MKSRIVCTAALLSLLAAGSRLEWPAGRSEAFAQQKADAKEFDALSAALVLEKTLVDAIAKAEKSVVSIARVSRTRRAVRERRRPRNFFQPGLPETDDPASPDFIPNDFGSGIVVAPDEKTGERVILTNYHVVKGGPVDKKANDKSESKLYVRLHNRRGFYASIIAADPRSDLAVLRIDGKQPGLKPAELPALKIAGRDMFRKGQLVLSLGNAYAQGRDGSASASWGMISNVLRRPKPPKATSPLDIRRNDTIHHYGTLLQVDTRLSIGTSGGALLNLKGELIGVTTSLAALSGYESSAGYAIPMNAETRRIVQTLAKGLEVEYGYLGISPQDYSPDGAGILPRRFKRQHAALASTVHPESPAARARVQPGDVILDIAGQPIHDQYDLMRVVGLSSPGSKVPLHIWRIGTGQELRLSVTLGKWPAINDEDIIATAHRYPAWRGVTVDHPTARRRFLQLPYRYHRAVVVLAVANPALSKNGDLQPGDYVSEVNGKAVSTPAEFHAAVRDVKGPVRLRLIGGNTVSVPE